MVTVMFCSTELENISRGMSLLSGLGEATGSPFRVVRLYRSPSPRTKSWPELLNDMPLMVSTASATLDRPFVRISAAPIFSTACADTLRSLIRAIVDSGFFLATTTTLSSASASVCISKSMTSSSPFLSLKAPDITSL